jgi:hypothetical protein
MLTQPAEYQVANYNIYPSPTICVEDGIDANVNVCAYLMEKVSGIVIEKGTSVETLSHCAKDFKPEICEHLVLNLKLCTLIA